MKKPFSLSIFLFILFFLAGKGVFAAQSLEVFQDRSEHIEIEEFYFVTVIKEGLPSKESLPKEKESQEKEEENQEKEKEKFEEDPNTGLAKFFIKEQCRIKFLLSALHFESANRDKRVCFSVGFNFQRQLCVWRI